MMKATLRTSIRRSRSVLVILLTIALVFSSVAPVFAWMEDDPKATSATNPCIGSDEETWWRFGWGQSVYPELTFTHPGEDPCPTGGTYPNLGFIYRIDRLPNSVPVTGDPVIDLSSDKTGSLFSHTFDLQGILENAPAGQWGYVAPAGQRQPIEGPWYFHMRYFNAQRVQDASATFTYELNVDVTRPSPATHFASSTSSSTTSTVVYLPHGFLTKKWAPGDELPSYWPKPGYDTTVSVPVVDYTRSRYTWDDPGSAAIYGLSSPDAYDGLAGAGRFRFTLDGQKTTTVQYLPWLGVPTRVTVEDLSAGINFAQLEVIDRAVNVSDPVTKLSIVDTDTPSLAIMQPASDDLTLQRVFTMSADSSDLGGVKNVKFEIDGSNVATVTKAPYTYSCDTTKLDETVPHSLKVTATDVYGRSVTAIRPFKVLQGAPSISLVQPTVDGQTIRGKYRFIASASADAPATITRVDFSIDGAAIASVNTPPYQVDYDTSLLPDGTHTLQAVAVTNQGKTAQISRPFTVTHALPTIEATPSVKMAEGADIEDPNVIWWTNSLAPKMNFASINGPGLSSTTGYYYTVDRSVATIPTFNSDCAPATNPLTEATLDIEGLSRLHPSDYQSGESVPVEGDDWNIHVRSFCATADGLSAVTAHGHFGIDVTPPSPVQGLTTDVSGWTDVYRHKLTWTDKVYQLRGGGAWMYPFTKGYDSLSGDASWVLSVNGGQKVEWDRYTGSPIAVATIENGLKPGKNTISVQVRDYAGNLSNPSYAYIYIDSDVPTVAFTAPTANKWVRGTSRFSVDARDAAGISQIQFAIDGVVKQTSTSEDLDFDTRSLSTGQHTVSARVRDMFGRTATASRTFNVDNVAPTITGISDAPDPFFPVIRDSYKDTSTIKLTTNKTLTNLYLEVFDGNTVVRQYHWTNVGGGARSLGWDGKNSSGQVLLKPFSEGATGKTFYYRLRGDDRAGASVTTAKYPTTIRNYEVIYVSAGKVKIVAR